MKTAFHLMIAGALACGLARAQGPALKPGVTVWLYETGEDMRELPVLVDGQTPTVSADFQTIDFSGAWDTTYGAPLADHYVGHAWGRMTISTGGTYEFRLTSDDGAKWFLGDEAALVIDNDQPGASATTATLNLLPGTFRYYVDFYQNTGSSRLLLEWKPPGAVSFETIPAGVLQTEEGQTHVTSPGLKSYYYDSGEGGTPGGPGDGRPLTGVHPSFDLVNFRPADFRPAVGGLDFLPDGRLAVSTWDSTGAVYLLDHLDDPAAVTVHRFAAGLGEPLGLKVIDGVIHVTQKQEVTRLIDHDGDDIADEYEAVAHGWPASFNYHEFTFNLVSKDGFLWVTTSVPLRSGSTAYLPGSEPAFPVPGGPGSLLKIDPVTRTWEAVANGLRTPNGMGVGIDGELFQSDNQGDWLPASRINHLRPGNYYGHRESPDDARPYTRPALWLPHGEISNSPAEPVQVPTGLYAGQMLVAELTHGGINRLFMEKVRGEYQGAVFQFTQGLESGMNRLVWGPDGSLYAGGLGAGGNWNWKNTTSGLQRLRPNGKVTFEMKSVRARGDGLLVEFTQPVPFSVASKPANYVLQQYRYVPESTYGGPKRDVVTLAATRVDVAPDRRSVFVEIPGMLEDHVVALRLKDFMNDAGLAPWATEAWYTMNLLPLETGPDFTPMDPPEEPDAPVPPADAAIHEAENAARSGPAIGTGNAGFSGTGFADYGTAVGETITWTVNAARAGSRWISFRYANGSTSARPLSLTVNGTQVHAGIPFDPSGSWTTWIFTEGLGVPLVEGSNTIRLTSTINNGPNVDHLYVCGPPSAAPPGAVILFDGTASSLANAWQRDDDGGAPSWPVSADAMAVAIQPSPNDISTLAGFRDFQLHVEWLSPPGGSGQEAGNSGVKLQRSYEIQVLNTAPGEALANNTAGAIYLHKPVDVNASLGAGVWQSYDVDFTAARWDGDVKTANARVTVRWNGVLVHDDVAIPGPTGISPAEAPGLHPLVLQAHSSGASGPVRYRNVWVIPKVAAGEQWESWLDEKELEGPDRDTAADTDRDGIGNLWEYVTGGNPKLPDLTAPSGESRMPRMSLKEEPGGRYLVFTFVRLADSLARGLDFVIETSPSLIAGSWTPRSWSLAGPPEPQGDGSLEKVTLRMDESVAGSLQLFARVRAELRD
ncbi:family 16 glycoside hydrolase [Luteolibacter marinus]|uniref:family 16 glycoside hydrolase n=1 Tax=Luteolibacter marinus TaxID=2776705 RepID=UPI001868A856|nr:family 16 glycoside hydrolase [Luteolibacter marinus]